MVDLNNTAPVSLFELISYIESSSDSRAIRFEPATYAKLLMNRSDSQKLLISQIQKSNGCSWHTALNIYSSSYGSAQIMGFNLYSSIANYRGHIVDFLNSRPLQVSAFNDYLNKSGLSLLTISQLASDPAARHHFAVSYNGSAEYADSIVAGLKHFNFSIKG